MAPVGRFLKFYLLDGFDRDLSSHVVGEGVLLDVQGGQPQCHVELELGRKSLLDHVITALRKNWVDSVCANGVTLPVSRCFSSVNV